MSVDRRRVEGYFYDHMVTVAPDFGDQLSTVIFGGAPREDLVTRVASALRDWIQTGKLARASRLPAETELAKQIGVSRPTLREATRILAREGLLEIRHGSGTYVSAGYGHITGSLDAMTSMSALIHESGANPGVQGLLIRRAKADERVAAALGIEIGTVVASIYRVRLMGNRPLAIAQEYIVMANAKRQFPLIRTFDGRSIYQFMASRLKMRVVRSETSLTAVLADTCQAKLLHLKKNAPLLCMREVHFDAGGNRVFYSVNFHNTAVIDFSLIRLGAKF